jgi:DNA-binding transcriptional LysR family regulator
MSGFDWSDLRFFLAIARTGRLTAAARQLRVDHATVSRRIGALETALKAKLFERHPQGYQLTEPGERLMAAAEAMEATAIGVESTISGTDSALSGIVRIGAPDGFGTYFLARRLAPLLARQPNLSVQLVPLPRVFSLAKREADLVIAIDPPKTARLRVQRLTDYTLGLYASRDYLSRHAPLKDISDLRSHRIVTYVSDLLFSESLDYLGELNVPDLLRFECASVIGQMEAVLAGIGIGVLHDYAAEPHPDLQQVLPNKIKRTYWIVAHEDAQNIARVNHVRDFIINTAAAEKFVFS